MVDVVAKKSKSKRRVKSDLGEHFIAPDGGYAWIVCTAIGISNFCTLPALQAFGLIYREKLLSLGITNAEMTTILNTQQAISSCTGLLNGPLFRRFTYRQIALGAACLIFAGVFASSFANGFITYLLYYSLLYGLGMGINYSATTVTLNTYFKKKRRSALSISLTIAGFSPIAIPYVANFLLISYGYQGSVWLFSGLALNTFACALTFQPAQWYAQAPKTANKIPKSEVNNECKENGVSLNVKEDRYTSSLSFDSDSINHSNSANENDFESAQWYAQVPKTANKVPNTEVNNECKENCVSLNDKEDRFVYTSSLNFDSDSINHSNSANEHDFQSAQWYAQVSKTANKIPNTEVNNECKENSVSSNDKEDRFHYTSSLSFDSDSINHSKSANEHDSNDNLKIEYKWYQKIAYFFELGLLKDITFINIMLGITLALFSDINAAILTPFFLSDFGLTNDQIALAMSLNGCIEVLSTYLLPFVIKNIKWDNRIFFMIGIVVNCSGRIWLSTVPQFPVILGLFCYLGIGKSLRTIFVNLIIPDYVPLNRLAAAAGLELLGTGLFTLSFGPIVGVVRDATNYSVTINFLNIMGLITVVLWTFELVFKKCHKRDK